VSLPWELPALAADPPGFLLRRAVAGGPITPLRLGRRPAYLVTGPAEVHQVLSQHRVFPKGVAHDPAQPEPGPPLALAFGNGLLSSSGAHHARQRRLMQPAFSPTSVASYADRMAEEAERFGASLVDRQGLELVPVLSELTLRIVTRTIFETPLPPADVRAIRSAVSAGQSLAGVRGLVRARNRAGAEHLLPKVRATMAPARQVIRRLVADRTAGPPHEDVLSLLLDTVDADTGERMSARDVEDEVLTLLVAGHETTTNALSWTFALLAANRPARERLRAEVDAVYAGGAKPTSLQLAELPWTAACLDEAMRLYPPAWLILRHTDQPTRIGGSSIPAGSTVVLSPFATQRIPALWPDAQDFRPDRFAPGGAAHPVRRRPLAAYLPFGGGPRICIGEHFALLEARIVLAVLTRDWRFEPVSRGVPHYRARITLSPKGGLPVTAHRRRSASGVG
jgi:cytochrome P450